MKILIIHCYYTINGGENRRVDEDIELYKSLGYEVEIFSKSNNSQFFNTLFSLLFSSFNLLIYFELKKIIKDFNPDVIHIHNTWFKIGPAAYIALKHSQAKIFQSMHNLRFFCANAFMIRNGTECTKCIKSRLYSIKYNCYKNRVLSALSSFHYFIISKLVISKNNNIYFFSPNSYFDNFIKSSYKVSEKNILKFPNYVKDFNNIPIQAVEVPKNYYLLVGRNSNEKGIDLLIKLWDFLDEEVKLVVASGNIETSKSKNKNIQFIDNCNDSQLSFLYQNCKAVIIPSIWAEGVPRVAIEASSVNKPIIFSEKVAISTLSEISEFTTRFDLSNLESLKLAINKVNTFEINGKFYFRKWYENNYSKEAYLKNIHLQYSRKVKLT